MAVTPVAGLPLRGAAARHERLQRLRPGGDGGVGIVRELKATVVPFEFRIAGTSGGGMRIAILSSSNVASKYAATLMMRGHEVIVGDGTVRATMVWRRSLNATVAYCSGENRRFGT
jgi:hypothetical protein